MKKTACRFPPLFVFMLLIITNVHSQAPDPQQKHYADSLLFLLNKAPIDTNRINLLNNLTTYLSRIRDYDGVFKYASEALDLSKKLGFKKGLKGAYQKLAMV